MKGGDDYMVACIEIDEGGKVKEMSRGRRFKELGKLQIIARHGDELQKPEVFTQLKEVINYKDTLDDFLQGKEVTKNLVREFVCMVLKVSSAKRVNTVAQLYWLYLCNQSLFKELLSEYDQTI